MIYKAVIFDLDGTLIDSMGVWEKIDKEFLGKRGIEAPSDYAEAIKVKSFDDAARYTIERFSLNETVEDITTEWHEMALNEYSHNIVLKPFAKEYLVKLKDKGIKIGLATSCSKYLFEPVLKNNGIFEFFDILCSTEEITTGKETPDLFLHTAKKMNVPPENCLVFEDILVAINSAKRAGMDVYGVYDRSSGQHWDEIKAAADGFIYDFSEAPMML